jgi:glutamate synthase domain-containing protein 1
LALVQVDAEKAVEPFEPLQHRGATAGQSEPIDGMYLLVHLERAEAQALYDCLGKYLV